MQRLALTAAQMDLSKLALRPEARIYGALRVPALVVGVHVGDVTPTYANYGQASAPPTKDCLMPMTGRFARALTR